MYQPIKVSKGNFVFLSHIYFKYILFLFAHQIVYFTSRNHTDLFVMVDKTITWSITMVKTYRHVISSIQFWRVVPLYIHVHLYARVLTRTYTHTHMHTLPKTHAHTHAHTLIQIYTSTHSYTFLHIQTQLSHLHTGIITQNIL